MRHFDQENSYRSYLNYIDVSKFKISESLEEALGNFKSIITSFEAE